MLGNVPTDQRWFPSPLAIIRWLAFLSIPIAVWLTLNYASLQDYFESQGELNMHKRELTQLEAARQRLIDEKRELEKGGFSTEKAARERFKMILPGEHVIYVEPEPGAEAPVAQIEPELGPNVAPSEPESAPASPSLDEPPPGAPVEDDRPPIE